MGRIFDTPDMIQQPLLEKVKQDFLLNNPVTVDVELNGQSLDDEKEFVLGCRAGPSISIENLFHEMSHLAEREIDKLVKRPYSSWGFSFGKYWQILGKSGYEPQTAQSVLREIRVWAFQISIQNHYQFNDAKDGLTMAEDLVSSAPYLSAWCYYRKYNNEQGFLETENEALKRAAEEATQLSEKTFTFARFCQDWEERMKALKKRRKRVKK